MRDLQPGQKASISFIVEEKHLASDMGSGSARVFATPMLVAGIEAAAVELVAPALEPGETTVGIHIDVFHNAATPLGMKVSFEAILEKVEGRKLTFRVSGKDEAGQIGEGMHERFVVNKEKFENKVKEKIERFQTAGDGNFPNA